MSFDSGEVFDYLVAHGRMKEKEARGKFRQVIYWLFIFIVVLNFQLCCFAKRCFVKQKRNVNALYFPMENCIF